MEETWYLDYRADLLRYVRAKWRLSAEDAEDIVSDAFLKIMVLRKKPEKPRAYVYACARNAAADYFRKRRLQIVPLDTAEYFVGAEDGDLLRVRVAMSRLPLNMRRCLYLKAAGFSGKEAAAIMNASHQAYRDLLMRAKRALKRSLSDCR